MNLMPQELQDKIRGNEISSKPGDNVIRSQNAIGPAKSRRRFSARVDTMPITLTLDESSLRDFIHWYRYDLKDGSLPFYMTHPVEGDTQKFKFTSQTYQYRSIGRKHYSVTTVLEVRS